MAMIDFLSHVYTQISSVHPRVYQYQAKEDTPFPYVTFWIPTGSDIYLYRQEFVLEVDVWDSNTDSTNVETIASAIDDILHMNVVHGDPFIRIYRNARFQLPDTDPKIQRRQLRYDCLLIK